MRDRLFNLSNSQRSELQRLYKRSTERRVAERIQAILLLADGRNIVDVASILRISKKTIKRWIAIFVNHGIDELCNLKYENSGAHSNLNSEQQLELKVYVESGIHSTKDVLTWVEQRFGVVYTESGIVKLLGRLGYSYKKPAQVPSKADADIQAEWIEEYT
jgi:transposase